MTEKMQKNAETLDCVRRTVDNFYDGYLEMDLGYKFRTREFMSIVFLYVNMVDTKNPDILGATNPNVQDYVMGPIIRKIKQQIRLDVRDLNFIVSGSNSLARFIPRAANRKILEENDFAEVMDEIPDNAADYGSGFLEVSESKGKLKLKSIDPFMLIFDQWDFKNGPKIKRLRRTWRWIIDNEKYDAGERAKIEKKVKKKKLDESATLYQCVRDLPDGTQQICVVELENDAVLYESEHKEKLVSYYKFDYEKRKGFPDALGVGCNEAVFNKLIQDKVNRERMDGVMEIASKLALQKQIDNEHDNLVGESFVELENGTVLGHKGNKLETLNLGGVQQANLIRSELNAIVASAGPAVNVQEALLGKTMPSDTSGVLGNLLTENSGSVLKEVQKNYAKFLGRPYRERIIPYILDAFDSEIDLKKYLTANDLKIVERSVRSYYVAQKYVDSVINGEPWNQAVAEQEVKKEMRGKPIVSGSLLESLREDLGGIRTFISGEDVNKPQAVAFLREMRANYAANPSFFRDPFYVEALKKEAEFDAGMSALEIEQMLEELPALAQEQSVPELAA